MRAITYHEAGGPDVLRLVDRPEPDPGPGEVRVRVHVSGVNPTDWKSRRGRSAPVTTATVPHQDGSGVIDAVGGGVTGLVTGQRVWMWEAAWQRPGGGTAQEVLTIPAVQAVPLPDTASFDLGAALGIPAMTAHRCLTVREGGPDRLSPGALADATVLVQGGAGAVGHAAIQLARWAGARVVTTVSSAAKAELARRAGAHEVVLRTSGDVVAALAAAAPAGVDVVVEVAPADNAAAVAEVLAQGAAVAVYADTGQAQASYPVRRLMTGNARLQFVLVYTAPRHAKLAAVEAISDAVAAGALPVGEAAGLPLHRFPLERTAEAHAAVESGAVGKVLVGVLPD